MKSSSTSALHHAKAGTFGRSERALLFAILLIGLVGLAITISGRQASMGISPSASSQFGVSEGKLRADHMILHLNQHIPDTPEAQGHKTF